MQDDMNIYISGQILKLNVHAKTEFNEFNTWLLRKSYDRFFLESNILDKETWQNQKVANCINNKNYIQLFVFV